MIPRALVLPSALVAAAALRALVGPPTGMVKIPGGTFEYGTDSSEIAGLVAKYDLPVTDIVSSEAPKFTVKMRDFYMDKHEVTVAEYVLFIMRDTTYLPKGDSGQVSNGDYLKPWQGGSVPQATDSLPVTYVTWFSARAYCHKQDKRLPTEVEWEYAARAGQTGDVYPWGDAPPDSSRVNFAGSGIDHPVKVARYPPNAFGLYDMAGNVWEFTADQWSDPRTPPTNKPVEVDPWSKDRSQAAHQRVVIRGGSYGGGSVNLRVRYRDSHPAGGAQPFVGFRCAKNY